MGTLNLKKALPTVFFIRENNELKQVIELTIENRGEAVNASLRVKTESTTYEINIGRISPGEDKYRIHISDIRQPAQVLFTLYANGEIQDELSTSWRPQRHWLVYVIQRAHHDSSYTDLPQNILEEYNSFYDSILQFCDETADWPDESRFRYQVETSWSILYYIKSRPKEVVDKLISLVKDGRIEVAALYGNEITAICSHEELIRLLYPSFMLKRKYGIPIKSAEINDIPGLSWGLSTVLANSGIKYLIAALPRWYFGGHHPNWDEKEFAPHGGPKAFYWMGPDGSKVLFWYGKHGWDEGMFFANGYEETYRVLPEKLKELEDEEYPFDAITFRVQAGHRDNSPPTVKPSYIAKEWNEQWAYPKIMLATNSDFYGYIESKYADKLPTFSGEMPCTDYVVGATSTPLETGINRVTHEIVSSAEKFCTIAAAVSDYPYPKEYLEKTYGNILMYDEHCWGMPDPFGPAQDSAINTKLGYAYMASATAHDCLSKSLNKIVDNISLPEESYYIIVFNALSWTRTDIVSAYLIEANPCGLLMHYQREKPSILVTGFAIGRDVVNLPTELLVKSFDLIDEDTGDKVPYQMIELSDPQAPIPWAGYRYALGHIDRRHLIELVFVAKDVPPMGYKTYKVVLTEQTTDLSSSIRVTDTSLENRFYRISVDPKSGLLTSIYDKELDAELIDKDAPYGFNQFIARSVTNGKVHVAQESKVEKCKSGPIVGSLIMKGDGVGCPQRTQEIMIYDQIKRIDIANRLLKDSTPLLEMYFAYPFNIKDPMIKFEATDSLITPLVDQIPGSNTDYYTLQHWANISEKRIGVTFSSIDAHLVEFGGLWPGYLSEAHHGVEQPGYGHEFLKPDAIKKGYVYSYVMNSNYCTNFHPIQVSDLLFRYSFTSHEGGYMGGRARDYGWEVQNPLVPVFMKGRTGGTLPSSKSFCHVDKKNVILLTLKVAEDENGLIVRIMETEGIDTMVTITLQFVNISEAYITNLQEENERSLSCQWNVVTVPIKALGITTVRVKSSGATGI